MSWKKRKLWQKRPEADDEVRATRLPTDPSVEKLRLFTPLKWEDRAYYWQAEYRGGWFGLGRATRHAGWWVRYIVENRWLLECETKHRKGWYKIVVRLWQIVSNPPVRPKGK